MSAPAPLLRAIALILTFLTGFSGLVYEVAWQKYLATLLGSQSEATSAVLGLFLGGLAAGYALFGVVARRAIERAERRAVAAPLLGIYGSVEIGIGLWAFGFPWLFGAVQRISFWMPPGHELLSFSFDIALSALLVLPPTILMGGTIPLLTQGLTRGLEDATRTHALVYASNTAGAFLGSLAAGFVLIHQLGLDGVLRWIGAVNLFAGGIFLVLGLRPADVVAARAEGAALPSPTPRRFAELALVAGLAGFGMMILQTVFNRVAALALGSSHLTFAMVVAVFVLCIALGSFTVSALPRVPTWLAAASQWLLIGLLVLIYWFVPDSGYAAHVLRTLLRDSPQAFIAFQGMIFYALAATLIVPIGLSGALLPLLFHQLRNEVGDLGRMAGSLYGWNTLGSLAGALIGGYVLLFWLDLHDVYAVALAALVIGAGILSVRVARAPLPLVAAGSALVLLGIALLPAWDPAKIGFGRFRSRQPTAASYQGRQAFYELHNRGTKIVYYDDDPVQSVAVLESTNPKQLAILNNGKSDSATVVDRATTCLMGVLPALLSDDPSRSFVVGWGTGITAGELAALDATKRVEVAEISPAVLSAAPLFSSANRNADANPEVVTLRRDAYRALLRSEGRFGVIASEPSNPWVTGVEMLFSREFLEAARARLTPGGVFAQWLHLYETDETSVEIIARTYASVFERVAVWFTQETDVLLIGLNASDGYPALDTLRERAARPDFAAALSRCGVHGLPQLLAHELVPPGLLRPEQSAGEVHSLRRPILSHHAARAFFTGRRVELPRMSGGPDAGAERPRALLAREIERAPLPEPVIAGIARHVCELQRSAECATWVAYWRHAFPASAAALAYDPRSQSTGGRSDLLAPAALGRIGQLLDGVVPVEPGVSDPLTRASRLSNLFSTYYVHAIPFDRALLRSAWGKCGGGGAVACASARQRANRLLERFELPRGN